MNFFIQKISYDMTRYDTSVVKSNWTRVVNFALFDFLSNIFLVDFVYFPEHTSIEVWL